MVLAVPSHVGLTLPVVHLSSPSCPAGPSQKESLFVPKNKSKAAFSKDIRIVLEWDNPKASFNVNFRSNEKGTTIYEHHNNHGSQDKNFSIEEFVISQLGRYNWYVDLAYFGDKKKLPILKQLVIIIGGEKINTPK